MSQLIPVDRFERACALRNKRVSDVCAEAAVSPKTIAKIRRGRPVSLRTALKLSTYFANIAPLPEMVDLLGVAS